MDTSLILLLVFLIAVEIQAFYFGFVSPPRTGAWLQQASFVILSFLLIPLLVYVLYSQAAAASRLGKYGIEAHPAIDSSIGIGNGYGDNPTWIFELKSDGEDILEFYRQDSSRDGWVLVEDNSLLLRFTRESKTMTIASRDSPDSKTLIIMIKSQ
ncbi:MAG: hypothetical protein GWP63_10195 [Haliea sp.]|nr:hypothetical protein [Haliea sp.]